MYDNKKKITEQESHESSLFDVDKKKITESESHESSSFDEE